MNGVRCVFGNREKANRLFSGMLSLVMAFVLIFSAWSSRSNAETILASGKWGGNLSWKVDTTGTLTIYGSGKMADGDAEEYIYPWMDASYGVTNLVVKTGVTSIAKRAFSDMEDLVLASFPTTLKTIEAGAFYGCGFESVTISKSVKEIGFGPFSCCKKLKWIDVDAGNNYFKTIDGVLYTKDGYYLIQYPSAKEGYYTARDGVGVIYGYAFEGSNITGITLKEDLKLIQYGAFSKCEGLTEIVIPEGVHTIEEYAFDECLNLSLVTLPTTLNTIGEYAFNGDGPVLGVTFTGTEFQWDKIKIGSHNDRLFIANKSFYDPYSQENVIPRAHLRWLTWGSTDYWYENGVRQGTYLDPQGVPDEDGEIRGREIYDPISDGWYWLDSVYSGAKAKNKEVWMPYVYNGEEEFDFDQIDELAERSAEMADQVRKAMSMHGLGRNSGKWVRYDADGKMIKGWFVVDGKQLATYPEQAGNIYYYDPVTGMMAKGWLKLGASYYHFDEVTGAFTPQ